MQRALAVAIHISVTIKSDAFSICEAPSGATTLSRRTLSPPHIIPRSNAPTDRRRVQRTGPLSVGGDIIPYYDEIMERLPSKIVLEEVDRKQGDPIVASDLAAKAGISLAQARKDLTTLASLTRGEIAVSFDGELLYSFPENVNAVRLAIYFPKSKPVTNLLQFEQRSI